MAGTPATGHGPEPSCPPGYEWFFEGSTLADGRPTTSGGCRIKSSHSGQGCPAGMEFTGGSAGSGGAAPGSSEYQARQSAGRCAPAGSAGTPSAGGSGNPGGGTAPPPTSPTGGGPGAPPAEPPGAPEGSPFEFPPFPGGQPPQGGPTGGPEPGGGGSPYSMMGLDQAGGEQMLSAPSSLRQGIGTRIQPQLSMALAGLKRIY